MLQLCPESCKCCLILWSHSMGCRRVLYCNNCNITLHKYLENILWHVNALPGNGSINTLWYTHQQWNNGVMQPASRQWLGKHTFAQAQWCHTPTILSYHMTCFLCGLHYAAIELCFLCCPCNGHITWVHLQLRRVQEGSADESTRTRMGHVLSEFWRLTEYRLGQRSTEWLKTIQQEDFIVIWSDSLCVEIRCQEMTSEDGES
jgi:hypothetical protein